MKHHACPNTIARREPLAFGLLTALCIWLVWCGVVHAAEWTDPPAMDLEDCIRVNRFMGPNPYSSVPNDFALVTSYQENHNGSATAPDTSYYLLNSVLVDQQGRTGVVYFSSLIVNVSRPDDDARRVSFWVMADTNGDGRLDKAVFRESEVSSSGEETPLSESIADERRLTVLQAYYEDAAGRLASKADTEPSDTCLQTKSETI
jgi:hypothetical protein